MNALAIGARLVYDGIEYAIEAIGPAHVVLRDDTGTALSVGHWAVQDTARIGSDTTDGIAPVLLFDTLPAAVRDRALGRAGHVREVLTGFRSGSPDDPAPGEPRPDYDPDRHHTLGARQQRKADEVGCSAMTIRRWCTAYVDHGVVGLVNKRDAALTDPLRHADERLLAIIDAVATRETRESTGTRNRFRRRVKDLARAADPPVPVPDNRTLTRYIDGIVAGRYTFAKATTRQSRALSPRAVGHASSASRAGEVVLIDGNRLDVLAWDPVHDVVVGVELLMALDAYTRAIVAARMVPRAVGRVDMCMLLADMLNPLEARPEWPDSVRFSALALPFDRLVSLDERLAHAAARPVIVPETLVVDNAKVNLSHAVRAACETAGISIDHARIRRPTDKAAIERAFGTVRTEFAEHVTGYKGPAVEHRGVRVDNSALYTIAELEELFMEWVVVVHNRRVNRSLRLPCAPGVALSPNEAFHESIARCGYLPVLPNRDLYFELLPVVWVTMEQSYVDVRGLSYSGRVLVGRDHEKSPYTHQGGKWPIRYDPRNCLYVYFQDRDGTWHSLRWIHARDGLAPFTDRTADYLRRVRAEDGDRKLFQRQLAEDLERFQSQCDVDPANAKRHKRMRSRDAERGRQAAADRARHGHTPTDTPAGEPLVGWDESFDLDALVALPVFGTEP